MLTVSDLTVDFGGVRAVDGITFSMGSGETLGIVGPNGSGKTTLLNALTGVVHATGSARLDEVRLPLGSPVRLSQAGLARVFQAPQIFPSLSCLENVLLGSASRRSIGYLSSLVLRPRMHREERTRWSQAALVLERVGLGGMGAVAGDALTYGQQRLLELARALVAEPRLLMLDEPSAGLNDAETDALAAIVESVRESSTAIVIVDHKLDFVERLCPRLLVMDFGRVVAEGAPADVWADPKVIEAYLGVSDA